MFRPLLIRSALDSHQRFLVETYGWFLSNKLALSHSERARKNLLQLAVGYATDQEARIAFLPACAA
jgi:hypothetical protein